MGSRRYKYKVDVHKRDLGFQQGAVNCNILCLCHWWEGKITPDADRKADRESLQAEALHRG